MTNPRRPCILTGTLVDRPANPSHRDEVFYVNESGERKVYFANESGAWAEIGGGLLNNYAATAAPTANEDSGDGYSVGSVWIDVTNDRAYVCLDATATAAVWQSILSPWSFTSSAIYPTDTADSVGIGTTSPSASAKLDITATDKGVLLPRMTNAQREAISSPASGLHAYSSTTRRLGFKDNGHPLWLDYALRLRRVTDADGFSIRMTGALPTGVGVAVTNIGAAKSQSNETTGVYLSQNPSTNGSLNGWRTTGLNETRRQYNPVFTCFFKTAASLTNVRHWIGFTDAAIANSDTLPGSGAAFRYSNGVDTGWVGVTRDGTTQSLTGDVASIAADTIYKLTIWFDDASGTVYFSVDDAPPTSITSNLPAAATEMGITAIHNLKAAGANSNKLGNADCWWPIS